jgi:hypothetical protein
MLDMKVELKIRILVYSWLPTGTYHKSLTIWIFFLQNLANSGQFFHEKSFVQLEIIFFRLNWAKFRPKKNTESSINIFSQIWQYSNYKSKKTLYTFDKMAKTLLKKSVLHSRDPLFTLTTEGQGEPIWSTCECYFVFLWRLHTYTTNQNNGNNIYLL